MLYLLWGLLKESVYVSSLSIAPEEHEVRMTESCAKMDLIIHHEAWHEVADWFDITC